MKMILKRKYKIEIKIRRRKSGRFFKNISNAMTKVFLGMKFMI